MTDAAIKQTNNTRLETWKEVMAAKKMTAIMCIVISHDPDEKQQVQLLFPRGMTHDSMISNLTEALKVAVKNSLTDSYET